MKISCCKTEDDSIEKVHLHFAFTQIIWHNQRSCAAAITSSDREFLFILFLSHNAMQMDLIVPLQSPSGMMCLCGVSVSVQENAIAIKKTCRQFYITETYGEQKERE